MKKTWLLTLPILLTLLNLMSCVRKEISFLKIEGVDVAYPLHSQAEMRRDSPFIPTMPVMPGDLVQLGYGGTLVAKGYRDQSISFREDTTGKAYKGDKLFSLYISEENKKELTLSSKEDQFSSLESVVLGTALDDSVRNILTIISKQKKHIAISNYVDSSQGELDFLLKTFDPWFLTSQIAEKDMGLLEHEQQLTHLSAFLTDSTIRYKLPYFKNLHMLSLASIKKVPDNFLSRNADLKDVLVSENVPMAVLKPLHNLRSLVAASPEDLDMNLLRSFPMKRLVIMGDTSIPAHDLAALHGLIWLGLPSQENQTAFDSLTGMLPNIEVIEMSAGEGIYDLKWATRWNMLRTMNLYKADLQKVKGLENLAQLKLLTFPFKTNKDVVKKLRRSLPDTTIIPNDGSCVGSFWLLLLIPMYISLRIIRRKTRIHA